MLPERGALRLKETSEMPSKGEEERCLKGLAESMEKIKKNNQRAAEELSRTEEMLESIQRAREAEEAESVARSAARRVPGVELTKPEITCRREPEGVMLLDHQPQRNQEGYNQRSQRWEKCL